LRSGEWGRWRSSRGSRRSIRRGNAGNLRRELLDLDAVERVDIDARQVANVQHCLPLEGRSHHLQFEHAQFAVGADGRVGRRLAPHRPTCGSIAQVALLQQPTRGSIGAVEPIQATTCGSCGAVAVRLGTTCGSSREVVLLQGATCGSVCDVAVVRQTNDQSVVSVALRSPTVTDEDLATREQANAHCAKLFWHKRQIRG